MAKGSSLIPLPRWFLVVIVFLVEKKEMPRRIPVALPFIYLEPDAKTAFENAYTFLRSMFFVKGKKKYIDPEGNVMYPLCQFSYELPEAEAKIFQDDLQEFMSGSNDRKKSSKKKLGKIIELFPNEDKKKPDPPKDPKK